uniref:CE022 n=1 Tax=Electrophorus electricus TaxID=8005 RepID=A0A4W4DN40_ELEEL
DKMERPPVKRTYAKLPVWIVEDHHDVVPHIYRAIGSRHMPARDIRMVHFDSHPDLLIPVNMPADTVFDKERLFSELSIENWIMPMVYAGHVSQVMWMHPDWAQQIKEGEHNMFVGRDTSTTTIRVTSTEDYFLSDALYVPAAQLEKPKPLRLNVIQVNPVDAPSSSHGRKDCSAAKKPKSSTNMEEEDCQPSCSESRNSTPRPPGGSTPPGNSHSTQAQIRTEDDSTASVVNTLLSIIGQADQYILDIDLDFFSCKNPFKDMYTQEEYSILQELYHFSRSHSLSSRSKEELLECVDRRTRQLEYLESTFADLLEDDSQRAMECWEFIPGMESVPKLVRSLKSRSESPDYEMVHQAGLTCDYSELPHHVSSEEEIRQLLLAVRLVLQALPKPTIVTIARSSLDEYCPAEQVNSIQNNVLDILENLFGSLDVHKEYESPSAENISQSS